MPSIHDIANSEHNSELKAKKVTIASYNFIQSEETETYKYYGFASSTGWQIKRKTLATGVWEVAQGTGDYDTNWTNRAGQTYSYT